MLAGPALIDQDRVSWMICIPLNLSAHCIQAETKRVYNRLLAECLKTSVIDPETESKIELLLYALENFDFPGLRAKHAVFAGGDESTVALVKDDGGQIAIMVDGRVVVP